MYAIATKKVNGVTYSVKVVQNTVKISSNRSATVEEMFAVAEELIRNQFSYINRPMAYFDDMGYLVIKEKQGKKKTTRRYNLDTTTKNFSAPVVYILAYGDASELSLTGSY